MRKRLQSALFKWHSSNKRHFIWREPSASADLVLVSEILLRKTRAEVVEPVVKALFRRYPSLVDFASAGLPSLEREIRPLGLHRIRSRALRDIGETLVNHHNGQVPRDLAGLLSLPHVGRYAANAVLCFAYGQPRPIVDSNVARIFSRLFCKPHPREIHGADELWEFAESLVPKNRPKEFNWALLDLGATVCTPRRPACNRCPLLSECVAHRTGKCRCDADGSSRQL